MTDLEKSAHAHTHRILGDRFQQAPEPLGLRETPAKKLFRTPSLDGWNQVEGTGQGLVSWQESRNVRPGGLLPRRGVIHNSSVLVTTFQAGQSK